jgi:hypothetical protein
MSNIKADNFTWKTGEATGQSRPSVTGPQVVYGVAKSWCNFNGTGTATVNASFNVSSLTDNGTGQFSTNFTNAMNDSFASGQLTCKDDGAGNGNGTQNAIHFTNGVLSTSLSVGCYGWAGSWYDLPTICTAVFR